MADSEGTRYTSRIENEKLTLIEEKLRTCIPVVALRFGEGVIFATASMIPGIRKGRVIHPSGLVFAGTGEAMALQQVALGLTTGAHLLELRAGRTSVTAEALIAQEETSGVLGIMRSLFVDSRMRPLIGDFMIAELESVKKRATFHYLSATGDRDADERFCVLGGIEITKSFGTLLKEESAIPSSRRAAIRLIERLWEECVREGTPEFSAVTYEHPQRLQNLVRGG